MLGACTLSGCMLFDSFLYGDPEEYSLVRTADASDFTSIAQIESYYDIRIIVVDPIWSQSQIVEIFNQQRVTLGPTFLQQLVEYYRVEGLPTRFVFETPNQVDEAMVGVDSRWVSFVIYNAEGAHESIIHEMGHLLQFYYEMEGYDVTADLASFNEGAAYLGDRWERYNTLPRGMDQIFVTLYAMFDPSEDFAETFSFAFRFPNHLYDGFVYEDGVILASQDPSTPLAQKVAYVRALAAFKTDLP